MMARRFRGSLAIAAGMVLLLVACGNPSSTNTGTKTNLRLVSPGKLTIGYSPYAVTIDIKDGKPVGVNGYLIDRIAKAMNLTPVYQSYDFPALVPALQSHRIDVLVDGFSVTQPRAQILYYNTPDFFGLETLIVQPGHTLHSWEEVAQKGLTLSTLKGSYQIGEWQSMGIKFHAFDYAALDSCIQDVIHGGSAGCAIGSVQILYLQATDPTNPEAKLEQDVMTGPRILADINAYAVAKDNPALANAISQQLTNQWRDGSVDKAFKSVFGSADYSILKKMPAGEIYYLPGAWEEGTVPTAPTDFPKVSTVASGSLTVGVTQDSAMLKLSGDSLSGPEAKILKFVADRLGLSLKGKRVSDEASALKQGTVDVLAGQLATTEDRTKHYWMTTPMGFNPDYIYVKPGAGGGYPSYTKWEDIKAAGGKIAVASDNPRLSDLQADGVNVSTFPSAKEALAAVASGDALGFVGTTSDYAAAASADPNITKAGIGWVRNINVYTHGDAYAWGVKPGNADLIDALNQGITLAWQQKALQSAYSDAWPGANVTALEAPGPSAIGTSFGASKDFRFIGMYLSGPWLQEPGYAQ